MQLYRGQCWLTGAISLGCLLSTQSAIAQISSDGNLPTKVNRSPRLVEATGWVRDEWGIVMLVPAEANEATSAYRLRSPQCHDLSSWRDRELPNANPKAKSVASPFLGSCRLPDAHGSLDSSILSSILFWSYTPVKGSSAGSQRQNL